MPTLFSTALPVSAFQIWFVVYLYALPILLYAAWATLSLLDLALAPQQANRTGWTLAVLLIPLLGGASYLLFAATGPNRSARRAAAIGGLLVWLLPLAVGFWLVGGPLGPKALG